MEFHIQLIVLTFDNVINLKFYPKQRIDHKTIFYWKSFKPIPICNIILIKKKCGKLVIRTRLLLVTLLYYWILSLVNSCFVKFCSIRFLDNHLKFHGFLYLSDDHIFASSPSFSTFFLVWWPHWKLRHLFAIVGCLLRITLHLPCSINAWLCHQDVNQNNALIILNEVEIY